MELSRARLSQVQHSFDATSAVSVLTLDLGRSGAIDLGFVNDLHGALDEVERAAARAAVITGTGRFFCGALDLETVFNLDRAAMDRLVDALDSLFRRLIALDRPLVAAINGHAMAGGCILAMACDARIMADGPFQIGANEVQFGVPLPASAIEILRHATPAPWLHTVLLQGKLFSPAEAQRAGLVNRLAGERGVLADAMDEARLFAAAGPLAVRALKADLNGTVLARIDATREAARARFVEHWFAPEAQNRLGALRDELAVRRQAAKK